MSIHIDAELCLNCGLCREICPGHIYETGEEGRVICGLPSDCWGCTACLKECPTQAIGLYLPPEAGGRGALMKVKVEGHQLNWLVTHPDGRVETLSTNRLLANNY